MHPRHRRTAANARPAVHGIRSPVRLRRNRGGSLEHPAKYNLRRL
jgi:hypothetical protein